MHAIKTVGAAMLLASVSLASEAAVSEQEVADLRQQVQALLARVEQLEARNQELAAGAAPAAKMEALEVRVADIEATNEAQTDRLAQAAAADKAAEWAGRIKWTGDLRYRHETIEEEGSAVRDRQRIRARLGLDAKVTDTLSAGFQLATGSATDPRSTNVTLGDSNSRDDIRLDLAYVDWRVFENAVLTAGKQKQPWFRAGGSQVYDSDVNPEGVALRWGGKTGPFASAWGYWLSESLTADSNLFGAQVGWTSAFGLTVAASYHDYGAIQGSSLFFEGYPAGNSTYLGNGSCNLPAPATGATRCYAYDYDILGLSAEYNLFVGGLPLQFWGEYVENQDPSELNQGYDVGARLGRAGDPRTWEVSLLYQDVERDAQWAGLVDSDFAGGDTQGKGLLLKAGWAPVRNVLLNLTYQDTTRSYDSSAERDYERLQLDFSFRF